MKIAYILNSYPQPSQSFIRRELMALERAGHEVTRIAMRRSPVALIDPQDRAEEARTTYLLEAGAGRLLAALLRAVSTRPVRVARALVAAWRMGGRARARARHLIYLAEAAAVLERLRGGGVAHMHAHFGTNPAAVAMLAHLLGGPGYSFTVHGPEEFDAPKALSLDEKMAHARFTVAVSSFGRSQLWRWLPHEMWGRVKVVHCGIDPADLATHAPPSSAAAGRLELVSIGRLAEQKGQLLLPEVLHRLRVELPDTDVHLTLIGDGPLRAALEAEIAARGLQAGITLAGWQAEAEVRAALARADVLILPSFAEGLPVVIMEAMAAARPVIATHIAGIPELVRPAETGWLVPAGDAQALALAVRELAGMPPERRAAMGQAGRARVLERHDMHDEAAKLATHIAAALPGEP